MRLNLLFLLLFILSPLLSHAQLDTLPNHGKRPKIGLCLSGGGAKGFAHIGVLKVLEEVGIRPDFIAGTSMGSIIGGLYAVGYSAQELEDLVLRLDWNKVLSDRIPLNEVVMEEKPFFKNQLFEIPLDNWKPKAPAALVQGQQIDLLLERLTLPVYDIDNFDSLPIPFRAIATNLATGDIVVLKEGDLAQALRASMAIPSIFAPVVLEDSTILVDGGVVRNFPASELLRMGADIIIGVNVSKVDVSPEDLNSAFEILLQTSTLIGLQDFPEQKALCDYFINVDLDNYSTGSFSDGLEIMQIGEAAGRDHQESLEDLAEMLSKLPPAPPVPRPQLAQEVLVERVEVNGNNTFSNVEILGRLEVRQGYNIRPARLDSMIHTLYGSNYFDKVGYSLHSDDNRNVLKIYAQEKSPIFLKLSILFDNYHSAGFIFNLTSRSLLWKRSRLHLHGQVSNNYRFGAAFLQHLSRNQRLMAEASVWYMRDRMPFTWNGFGLGRTDQGRLQLDLRFKYRTGRNSMLHFGGQLEYLNINTNTGDLSLFDEQRLVNFNGVLGFEVNTLDRHHLPRKGIKLKVEGKFISNLREQFAGPDSSFIEIRDSLPPLLAYPRLQIQMESHLPLGQSWQLSLNPALGVMWSRGNLYNDYFMMGSPVAVSPLSLPFIGYGANNFATSASATLEIGGHYFIRDDLAFGLLASGGMFQFPDMSDLEKWPYEDLEFYSSVSIRGGYNFLLGLLSIDLSYPIIAGDEVNRNMTVFINFGYRF